MTTNAILSQLQKTFKDRESFSKEELHEFYLNYEPDLKETTFRWRIYNLKDKHLIRAISRNEFTLTYRPAYKPIIGKGDRKLFTLIDKEFKESIKAVWSTNIVNEFMLHQPFRFFTLLEVEKEVAESVFHYLLDKKVKKVFLQPEEKVVHRYVSELDDAIIVQSLISKAPLQTVNGIYTLTIEKLLVDLFCDPKLFFTYQGSELAFTFNSAYNRYAIDFTKLFSYAERRKRASDLIQFLSDYTEIPKNILNDR